ncbi:hypothetical protein ACS0TY_003489 [Phlomoides rotata]
MEWRGAWSWKWRWRRELFDRESDLLNDMISVLGFSSLKQGIVDTWRWRIGVDGIYSTKKAYEHLLLRKIGDIEGTKEEFELIWNNLVPPKIHFHSWRVLWERIPTTMKMSNRRSLPSNVSTNCIFCNEVPETVHHIFFECNFSYQVWMEIFKWLGFSSVLSSRPSTNLLHFSRLLRGKKGKEILVSIWDCIIWIIWKTRNEFVFQQVQFSKNKFIEELQARVWGWINEKYINSSVADYIVWIQEPMKIMM